MFTLIMLLLRGISHLASDPAKASAALPAAWPPAAAAARDPEQTMLSDIPQSPFRTDPSQLALPAPGTSASPGCNGGGSPSSPNSAIATFESTRTHTRTHVHTRTHASCWVEAFCGACQVSSNFLPALSPPCNARTQLCHSAPPVVVVVHVSVSLPRSRGSVHRALQKRETAAVFRGAIRRRDISDKSPCAGASGRGSRRGADVNLQRDVAVIALALVVFFT